MFSLLNRDLRNIKLTAKDCMPLLKETHIDWINIEWDAISIDIGKDLGILKSYYADAFNRLKRITSNETEYSEADRKFDEDLKTYISNLRAMVQEKLSSCEITTVTFETILNLILNKAHSTDTRAILETSALFNILERVGNSISESEDLESESFEKFIDFSFRYFGSFGLRAIAKGLGKLPHYLFECSPELFFLYFQMDDKDEKSRELPVDGRLWFDIESLVTRWKRFGLSMKDIHHAIEIGNLEVCFNHDAITNDYYYFYSNSKSLGSVSPLIRFKREYGKIFERTDHSGYKYPYSIDIASSCTKLHELAAIDTSTFKRILYQGKTDVILANVNGYSMFLELTSGQYLDIDRLLVTSREIRRYEKEVLLQIEKSGSKFKNGVEISEAEKLSHLKVISALVQLLKKDRTRPYTQDMIQDELSMHYGEKMNLKSFSKSNLQKIFSKANSAMKDE